MGFDDNGNSQDEPGNNDQNPGGLRKFAETVQKENRDLKTQLEQIQETLRRQQLQSVFVDAGAPDALSQYEGEADPVKAKAWIDEQRRIFGAPATPVVDTQQQPAETLTSEQQQQLQQMTQAGQSGTPLGSFEQAHANVNGANDLQSLIAAMSAAQR